VTRHDIAVLAIRLAALYAWFQALEYVAGGVIMFYISQSKVFGGASPFAMVIYVLPFIVLVAAGLLLWLSAPALSRHFLSSHSEAATSAHSSPAALAFAIAGLAVFLYALPRAVSECITMLRSQHFVGQDAWPEFAQHLPSLAGTAVQLICGFVLFVRPDRLARWWERKRDANVSV
jgi:hypothetical protein